ncbi:MAG: hypothetical protein K9G49_11035 [Taibaiella sp.]|nr:hypothetical protein [Taibaiella sp.]
MRGSVLLLLAVAGIVGMSSCVKKYTCQCSIVYSGAPGLPDSTTNEYDINDTKKAAESLCEDASFEKIENGIKIVETCKLY